MMASDYMKPILLVHDSEGGQSAGSVRSKVPIKQYLVDSGLFDYNKGHEDYAFGTAYQTYREQDIIDYLDSLTTIQKPCVDVLASSMITNIPSRLYSLKMDYNELWSKGVDKPIYHIQPFTIYNTSIKQLGKGNTIKFNHQGVDFIMFFVSNKIKEQLYMGESERKLEIECIVELSVNEYMGKKTNQAIIQQLEVREVKQPTFDDLFG
jgi:hypothetical protein